jgi:MFS family permease
MRPLNASDRVEDAQVEDALDAPLRRGVELARLALVASLGGFARGYDAVVAATAVAQARDEFSAGRWLDYTAPGVAALGALAGAAFGGVASDAFGRKRVAFVCDALFIAGACLALSAPGALTLALARLVAGLASGASAANAPAFLLELAPRNIRGGVVAADAAGAAAGALAARILAPRDADDGSLWRVSLGATAIPAAVQAAGMFWVPESPAWLANKGLRRQARAVARRAGVSPADLETPARGPPRVPGAGYGVSGVSGVSGDGDDGSVGLMPGANDDDDSEMSRDESDEDEFRVEVGTRTSAAPSGVFDASSVASVALDAVAGGFGASSHRKAGERSSARASVAAARRVSARRGSVSGRGREPRGWFSFARRSVRSLRRVATREDLRPRLRLAAAAQAAQQLVGAQALAYYGAHIAQAAGVAGKENARHIAIAVAFVCVLGSLAGAFAADALGRRPAFLGSALACAAALGALAAVFYDLERGTSAPVSEVPGGACAAAASCRECLAVACGFCAAGGADAATAPGRCLAAAADGLPANSREAVLAEERRRARLANEAPPPWSDALIHHHETRSPPPPPPPSPPPPAADAAVSSAERAPLPGFSAVARPPAAPPPPIPPAPAPPHAKHRAHQNIVACDGNWQYESCPSRFKLGALVAYAAFFFSYHFGVAIVPWIISAEMFPVDVRGTAIGVAAFVHFLANALLAVLYPVMFEAMGAAVTFSVLFVCAKAAFGLAAFSTPETRDSSVSEIAVKVRHADPRRFFSFRDSRAAGEGARGSAAASASARGGYDRVATETYA